MQTRRNQDYVLIASKSVIFLHLLFYCVSVTPHSFVNFPFLMHFSLFLEKKKNQLTMSVLLNWPHQIQPTAFRNLKQKVVEHLHRFLFTSENLIGLITDVALVYFWAFWNHPCRGKTVQCATFWINRLIYSFLLKVRGSNYWCALDHFNFRCMFRYIFIGLRKDWGLRQQWLAKAAHVPFPHAV